MARSMGSTLQKKSVSCEQSLKAAGLRPSRQRQALLRHIFDSPPQHFSAEHLHAAMCRKGAKMSLATIYNTLRLLTRLDWLRAIPLEKGLSVFDSNVSNHHHLYNTKTQEIVDIDTIPVPSMPRLPKGLALERIDVVLRVRPEPSDHDPIKPHEPRSRSAQK